MLMSDHKMQTKIIILLISNYDIYTLYGILAEVFTIHAIFREFFEILCKVIGSKNSHGWEYKINFNIE